MAAPASTNYLTSNSRAIICAQIGQEKLAEHLFSMAVENAQTGGSLWSQVQGLSTIARSQIQCGFKKQGRANLRSALQLGVNESLVIIEMIDAGMLEQAQSAFNSLRKKDGKSRQGSELRLRLAIACAERGHFQDSIKYAIGIKDIDIRQYTFFNMAAIHCTFGSGKIDHDEFRPYLLQLADRKFKAAFSFEESKHAKAIFSASKYSKTIE